MFKYGLFGKGYDKEGYNKYGFNRDGYDKNGFNVEGYDRNGYNREGYNKNGYNSCGFDKQGYNEYGYNESGYDREGFDIEGYNRDGYNREGYNKEGYNLYGFDKRGYNIHGYNINGYDIDGFNAEGYNRMGYDRDGFDKNGFDYEGYNKDGYNVNGYNKRGERLINNNKLIELTSLAYESMDKCILRELGDVFQTGDCGIENRELATYIYNIANGMFVNVSEQYYLSPSKNDFIKKEDGYQKSFNEENIHLKEVKNQIDIDIEKRSLGIQEIDNETWWMDNDQKREWRKKRVDNHIKTQEIYELYELKKRPYYARMDLFSYDTNNIIYIGEKAYICDNESLNVYSVWSDIGRKYREKRSLSFYYNGQQHDVQLRRNIDVVDGELSEIFDEYKINSDESRANITDQYLLKVLREKKGEKNITNIIRSIQENQNRIIDYDFNKSLIVQGCAGSGKTMILLHRLANMKFNNDKVNYDKVKIITPNSNFTLFIDDLTKNLGIDLIPKMTISEYWIDIISRYRILNTAGSNLSYDLSGLLTHEFPKEICDLIYSSEFALELKSQVEQIPINLMYNQNGSIPKIDNAIENTFIKFGYEDIKIKDRKENGKTIHSNITVSILYSKVLALYYYYGALPERYCDKLLCIDEGQDISLLQYVLMLRINNNSLKFNVYGDINQQISTGCNIGDWKLLEKNIDCEIFELEENYRNSEEVVRFYNERLNLSNKSFGIKTKNVEVISSRYEYIWKIVLNLILNNRTAIICNDKDCIPDELKKYCSYNELFHERKAVVLNIKQAKGLEFDSVFVFDSDLTRNEKYIAYTRALSELYVLK